MLTGVDRTTGLDQEMRLAKVGPEGNRALYGSRHHLGRRAGVPDPEIYWPGFPAAILNAPTCLSSITLG